MWKGWKTNLPSSANWRGVSSSGHRGRHGRPVAVDWSASIQYTGSNRSAETHWRHVERASPRISCFSFAFTVARTNWKEEERCPHRRQDCISKSRLTTATSRYERIGKERGGETRSEKVRELRKGNDGAEERCRINTRPYTEEAVL